jgi:hypothetical protein
MQLAIALLAQTNQGFRYYADTLNGHSINEISARYSVAPPVVAERLEATRLSLRMLKLEVNSSWFDQAAA